ncbi:hypothetical protein CMI47_20285 [Candidatus Pacearchaeota archaeon]|nr:hypothetical protein [Candidatus Pacearchaeota archaeon]|tara:strand:+ start:7858 stop:8271 length:414 start_codon:yes stop_codon:yes gene_type:complete
METLDIAEIANIGRAQTSDGFEPWQRGVVTVIRSKAFQKAFRRFVSGLSEPDAHPEVLLEALKNYFSYRNPGFSANWWHFSKSELTMRIDECGFYFEHPDDDGFAIAATQVLAGAIPETRWRTSFLRPHPLRDRVSK